MSGIGSPGGRDAPEDPAGEGSGRYDDDALADAIYLSYTASIPIVSAPPPDEDRETVVSQEAIPEPVVAEPAVPGPTVPGPTVPGQAVPAPPRAPEAEPPVEPGHVWDLDDLQRSEPFLAPGPTPFSSPVPESWTRLAEPAEPAEPELRGDVEAGSPGWSAPDWAPPDADGPAAPPQLSADQGSDPEPPAEEERSTEEPPKSPSVRRDPIPWFDLAAAAPPDPSTVTSASRVAPPPPALVEPAPELDDPPVPEPPHAPGPAPESEPHSEPEPDPDGEQEIVASAESIVVPAAILPIPPSRPSDPDATPDRPAPTMTIAATAEPTSEPPSVRVVRLPAVRPVERAGIAPTPIDQRAGRAGRLFWLWFAANASVLSVALGSGLIALGLSPRQALIAIVLGLALSFLPLGVGAVAGRWSGQPTLVVSRATFGVIGNAVPAVLAVVTRIGWAGVLVWLGGSAVTAALARDGIVVPDAGIRLGSWVGPGSGVIVGVCATLLATIGYGLLSRAQFVIGATVAVLGVGLLTLTGSRLDPARILSVSDGPWMLVLPGAIVVFVFVGLAWAQSGADLARYQRPRSSASGSVLAAASGAALPALVLMAWGALLAASLPSDAARLDRSPVAGVVALVPDWAVFPVAAVVLLSSLAGAAVAAYSAGFALQAVGLRISRAGAALVSAALATAVGAALLVVGVSTRAVIGDFATTLAIPVAAWLGLFGGEVLTRTRQFHAPSLVQRGGIYPDVRVVNLVALVVAAIAGLGFASATTPWLAWEGWFFPLLGIPRTDPVAESHLGVLVALGLALLVPIVASLTPVSRREAALA